MLFPTLDFGLFFLVTFVAVWAVSRSNEWRKIVLLVASWVFYGAWDWRFVALLIGSAFLNWGAARLIADAADGPHSLTRPSRAQSRDLSEHGPEPDPSMSFDGGKSLDYARDERFSRISPRFRKPVLIAGVAANLAILGAFKYYGFFLEQLATLLAAAGFQRDLPLVQVILPVGVSFFTFQGMSYLIDVYKRRVPAASLLDITVLMSFFPHLVAGPIVRAADLVPQLKRTPKLDRGMVAMALLLIVWGLFKKAVVASELATQFVDPVFADIAGHSPADLWLAAYGYAVQIYCDFSAYSDMAIGIAALLGYRFPRNFDQPYRAASLQEFWRRWHISLSSWLRDYLYIDALGGNRGGVWYICRNLMVTMLLGGLWHGAKWTFLIWGGLHGGVLAIERLWREYRPAGWPLLPRWAGILVTFHIVTLGWIFFRAPSFADAQAYLAGMVSGTASGSGNGGFVATPLQVALILFGLAIHAAPPRLMQAIAQRVRAWPAPLLGLATGVAILLIDAMRFEGIAPFIYYQF